MTRKTSDIPHYTALLYAVFAGAWIFFSDRLLEIFVPDLHTLNIVQTYKGLFFVIVTTLILFSVLKVRIDNLHGILESKSIADGALREREDQFRLIYENSGDAILLTNPAGAILSANPAACRMFKRSEKELCALGRDGIVDMNDPNLQDAIEERRKTGRYFGVINMKRSDGSIFPAHISSNVFLSSDGKERSSMIVREMTPREQLEKEKILLSEIIDKSLNEIYLFDIHTLQFRYVNTGALNHLGYTHDEIMQLTPVSIKPQYTEESFRQFVAPLLNGSKESLDFETIHRRKNGTEYPVQVFLQILHSKEGPLFFAVILDITERTMAEQEIRQKDEYIRTVMDNLPIGVAVNSVDPHVHFSYMNDIFLQLYRTTREALSQPDNFWNAAYEDPAFREEIRKRVLDDVLSGDVCRMVWEGIPITRTGSETTYISARNTPIPGTDLTISTVWDVTEQKRAEMALKESEARWQFALEGQGDGVWDWNVATNTVKFSHQWKAMLGYSDDEIGMTLDEWEKRVHPEDLSHIYEAINKHFSNETTVFESEHRMLCKDGTYIWILTRGKVLSRDADGKPLRVIGTHRNINDRVQKEDSLRQSEARLRLSLQAANQGTFDLNVITGETIVSPEYATMLGYDPATFVETNQAWIDRLHPDDREPVSSIYHEYISGNIPEYRVEFRQLTSIGEWKWILSIGKVVEWTPDGQPQRMLGTHTDITDKKNKEEEIEKQLEELRRWHDAMLGREKRISELKQEVNELLTTLGEPVRYRSVKHEGNIHD